MLYSKDLAEKAVKILSKNSSLSISSENKIRTIACKTLSFDLCEKIGKFRKFILQIECDDPYFIDSKEKEMFLFKRYNLVSGAMSLPCVFTGRYEDSRLVNEGDEIVYPKIVINACTNSKIEGDKYLKFTNETLGKEIVLNCDMQIGEIITLDLEKRSISSNIQGNLLNFLSDCYLSDFYLIPGINKILFENHTSSFGEAVVYYKNKYRECVF